MNPEHQLLERALDHNAWAIRQLLSCCRGMPEEEFHRDFEIGLGNLHATLSHVITAMGRWSDRVSGRPPRELPEGPWSVEELESMLCDLDGQLREAVLGIVERGELGEIMEFRLVRGGRDGGEDDVFHFTKCSAVVHILSHGVHHRAQALNMLRHLGREVPDLDPITCELDSQD